MGLILICVTLIFIITLLLPSTSMRRIPKGERLLYSIILGILLGVPLSSAISSLLLNKDNSSELEAFIVNTYELEEFRPGIYVTTEIPEDIPKLVVRTEEVDQRINITDTSIQFNSDETYMEELKLDYSNGFLRWLLIRPYTCKYNVYTPQSTIDGLYKLITD